MAATQSSYLDYVFHHVFLPPRRPQSCDDNESHNRQLLQDVVQALCDFRCLRPQNEAEQWTRWYLDAPTLAGNLRTLSTEQKSLAIEVRSQNAGVIVSRSPNGTVVFEMFELSPSSAAVMGTPGRLRRSFVGPGVALAATRLSDAAFCNFLAQSIAMLDAESFESALPTAEKARSSVPEARDTSHPKYVTHLLSTVLGALGSTTLVRPIHKHIRDDVLWSNTDIPWRRSPTWLLVRVALQRTLIAEGPEPPTHTSHKAFLVYFMTRVLEKARAATSETRYMIRAKILRRLQKLSPGDDEAWYSSVCHTIKMDYERDLQVWDNCQSSPDLFGTRALWSGVPQNDAQETNLSLKRLRKHFASIRRRDIKSAKTTSFIPPSTPRCAISADRLPSLDRAQTHSEEAQQILLYDVESWVQGKLDTWLAASDASEQVCAGLASLIQTYVSIALELYAGEPESFSIMCLTTMELWIALDQRVAQKHSLLCDYPTGFPEGLLNHLLLPQKSHLARLQKIEVYLHRRERAAQGGLPSPLHDMNDGSALGVRYFAGSTLHRSLRDKIEADAEKKKAQKVAELTEKRERYHELVRRAEAMTCEYTTPTKRYGRPFPNHSNRCKKCQIKRQAEDMHIDVHEWPLPQNQTESKAAIFELAVPKAIFHWRNVTYFVQKMIFSQKRSARGQQEKVYHLLQYEPLTRYLQSSPGLLGAGSEKKAFIVAHYRQQKVSVASESSVCVNHGMRYRFYDTTNLVPTSDVIGRFDIHSACTLPIPAGSYERLKDLMKDTQHTSNAVQARQADCSHEMTLHEHEAYGEMRCGENLQLYNVARELAVPVLDMSRVEVSSLILQTIWQAGSSDGQAILRKAHLPLDDKSFTSDMLDSIEDAFRRYEGNWQRWNAVYVLMTLTQRVFSTTVHRSNRKRAASLLRLIRNTTIAWTRDLVEARLHASSDEHRSEMSGHILNAALVCHATFDGEGHLMAHVLVNDEDLTVYFESLITINDHLRASPDSSLYRQYLLTRKSRISHCLERLVQCMLRQCATGLNAAIKRVWPAFSPCEWKETVTPWLETCSTTHARRQTVHFDLLDGSLLVDGAPLSRPTTRILDDPSYIVLFGKTAVDVIPSNMPGMLLECRADVHGYRVHFGLLNDKLIIRAQVDDEVLEFVPEEHLTGDFPTHLVTEYVHWISVTTWKLAWRPKAQPWVSCPRSWSLVPERDTYTLERNEELLVDSDAPTFTATAQLLAGLDQPNHIQVCRRLESGDLEVTLPRLQLEFYGTCGDSDLRCRQYPGMTIDRNQDIGTWTGLQSKLVLCSLDRMVRKVIVPFGNIHFGRVSNRTEVKILSDAGRIRYFVYTVDNCLGRLKGDEIAASRLYLSYLHAVTSTSFEDRLTGMTGTEKALDLLAEPAVRSRVDVYDEVELDLLSKIAALSPQRQYYPSHLHVMQQIVWSDQLPTLSQHYRFQGRVQEILDDMAAIQLFHPSSSSAKQPPKATDKTLEDKAALHEAPFRVDNFGAEAHTRESDTRYVGREHDHSPDLRLEQVYQLCQLIDKGSARLQPSQDMFKTFEQWGVLHGPLHEHQPFARLALRSEWLRDPLEALPKSWFSIQTQLARPSSESVKYHLMFLVSMLTTNSKVSIAWLETLMAFNVSSWLQRQEPPSYEIWYLFDGCEPDRTRLLTLAAHHANPFETSPMYDRGWSGQDLSSASSYQQENAFANAKEEFCQKLVVALLDQWPCAGRDLNSPQLAGHAYVDVAPVISATRPLFDSWYRNRRLQIYVKGLQPELTRLRPTTRSRPESCPVCDFDVTESTTRETPGHLDLWTLLSGNAPESGVFRFSKLHQVLRLRRVSRNYNAVRQLAEEDEVARRYSGVHEIFRVDLLASVSALQERRAHEWCEQPASWSQLVKEYADASLVDSSYKMMQIRGALSDDLSSAQTLAMECQMKPRTGPFSLLKLLSALNRSRLSPAWKKALVNYGLSLTAVQQASRFLTLQHDFVQVSSELQLGSHKNWDPAEHPDWLLFELETGKIIKPVQARIAFEMLQTHDDGGSILQLNMGEGKTSVIIPLVAMSMMSANCLARVIVLKQLAPSMMSNLATCLGGLAGRTIRYLPFSRSVQLSSLQILSLQMRLKESLSSGDVWLAQPEHVLSFELYGIDHLLRDHASEGKRSIGLQKWIDGNARNILDESDEILNPRHELIYTMGTQRSVDLGPARWSLIMEVLDLVNSVARSRAVASFAEISIDQDNAFPFLRITKQTEGEIFLKDVLEQILSTGLTTVPLQRLESQQRAGLRDFLTQKAPSESAAAEVGTLFKSDPGAQKGMLLLRGLFGGGLLMFVLQRHRWRVSYGLAPWRSSLAVPYRAKDQPSLRSDFSHPDVTIALTSLSYFYRGLTESELRRCFDTLVRTDNAEDEYQLWVKSCPDTKSATPTQLTSINLEDHAQWSKAVFPALARAKEVVKFHLSHHVFPHAMREFPHKLAMSGWNLGKRCHHPTAGFSGTNDGRFLLPTSLRQIDLPEQRYTNALVLDNLLQSENAVHYLPALSATSKPQTVHILETISRLQPNIQVVIDVGAQMLDMDNKSVACTWLSLRADRGIEAAVFYDNDDRALVVNRNGFVEPLQGSPRADLLETCLIYLDDVHTRGVDFRFPSGFRAAVTLAPGLVKDRLSQACMRMRRLGNGHSVVFLVQEEVRNAIHETWTDTARRDLSVGDIIRWTIRQTYDNVHHLLPLWVNQGIQFRDFANNMKLIHSANDDSRKTAAEALLQDEAQTIRQRYGACESPQQELESRLDRLCQSEWQDAQRILQIWKAFRAEGPELSGLQEEQERELSPESEQEQQIERPPAAKPLQHQVHPDVRRFVRTGVIAHESSAFQCCLSLGLLRREPPSGLVGLPDISNLVTTVDFAQSIKGGDRPGAEDFSKSFRWLVRSSSHGTCVVLSSFEANELLPQIRTSQHVQLSVYAARTSMNNRTLEDLTFCKVPSDRSLPRLAPSATTLLTVFAGQTCFADWGAYQNFCQLFGVYYGGQAPADIEPNGFITKERRREYDEQMDQCCPFDSSPLHWLSEVVATRRKGQPYDGSHIGLVLRGRVLRRDRHWQGESTTTS